jgi:D-serine/D-alanine/glycine transporter
MILIAYLAYCKRLPQAHDESEFKMPLSKIMPYVAFVFFAIVLYALTLSDQTRIALYFLPVWFIVLGIFYRIKTKNSKQHQIQLAAFREKVIAEEVAAKAYRANPQSR